MAKEKENAPEMPKKHPGFCRTLSLLAGKYKIEILYFMMTYKPVLRFNELKRCIPAISYKTLSSTLKELEEDELIIRTEYPQVPPKVEYCMSEKGKTLIPIIHSLCQWGEEHMGEYKGKYKEPSQPK